MSTLIRYRKIWIVSSWLLSLATVLLVLVLADFGAPQWIFVSCGLWLSSFGLPTTLSVLALAEVWGKIPGMGTPPLAAFAICVAALSLVAQTISFYAVIRVWNRRRRP
jgi:hypothetical protein